MINSLCGVDSMNIWWSTLSPPMANKRKFRLWSFEIVCRCSILRFEDLQCESMSIRKPRSHIRRCSFLIFFHWYKVHLTLKERPSCLRSLCNPSGAFDFWRHAQTLPSVWLSPPGLIDTSCLSGVPPIREVVHEEGQYKATLKYQTVTDKEENTFQMVPPVS